MKWKRPLIFIGLLIFAWYVNILNLNANLIFISHSIETPWINKIASEGYEIKNYSFKSRKRLVLEKLKERLNITYDNFRGDSEEDLIKNLRAEFNTKFKEEKGKYLLSHPKLITIYEISAFNHLHSSENRRIDDVLGYHLHEGITTTIEGLISYRLEERYKEICDRPTEECNTQFLEELKGFNDELENNITSMEDSLIIEDSKRDCWSFRDYLWMEYMEDELEDHYIKGETDEVSRTMGLSFLKLHKVCSLYLSSKLDNSTRGCMKPESIIGSSFIIAGRMSYNGVISYCMASESKAILPEG